MWLLVGLDKSNDVRKDPGVVSQRNTEGGNQADMVFIGVQVRGHVTALCSYVLRQALHIAGADSVVRATLAELRPGLR